MDEIKEMIESLEESVELLEKEAYWSYADSIRDAISLLKAQPQIVRCKECKFHHASKKLNLCWCEKDFIEGLHSREWFCADGEREDEDNE